MTKLTTSRLRIVVLGYIVRGPIGGMTWHYLNYVLGLDGLGHDVLFVEDSDDYPSCYNPETHLVESDPAYGLAYIEEVFERLSLADKWAYYDAHESRWYGRNGTDALSFLRSADVLINVSGVNPIRDWMLAPTVRVLIDTDPLVTQVRHLNDSTARERAQAHTHFLTFGENVGAPDCEMPDDGFPWLPTRQPIALEQWPGAPLPDAAPFTTIMQWDSYDTVEHGGKTYGMKSKSFEAYADLPKNTNALLEIALGTPDAPRDQLRRNGWRLINPLDISTSPWTYRDYIQASAGEFSVAKHCYVAARTGWFSERSACYLATGRPVILQDTGYAGHLPTGAGLFAFNDADEALSALERCRANAAAEAEAARALAQTCFDARIVLNALLDAVTSSNRVQAE